MNYFTLTRVEMPGWRKLRELAEEFKRGILRAKGLRFDVGYLRGYEISQQFYCEYKLHLDYEKGLVNLEVRNTSTKRMVMRLLSVSKTPTDRGWIRVPLIGLVFSIPVITTPDAIYVENDEVKYVVKVYESSARRLYLSEEAIARLHLYLLSQLGFDVSNAKYYLIKGDKQQIRQVLKQLMGELEASHPSAFIYRLAHDELRASELLSWAIAYWRSVRDPVPRPSAGKCAACQHASYCPYSKANP